eukprot:8955598-Heterocapsa_arctica.AAC.1
MLIAVRAVVLTNQCPFCEMILTTRKQAKYHAQKCIIRAHPRRQHSSIAVQPILDIICPVCKIRYQQLSVYNRHVRGHLSRQLDQGPQQLRREQDLQPQEQRAQGSSIRSSTSDSSSSSSSCSSSSTSSSSAD